MLPAYLVALAAITLVASGCGGSTKSSTQTSATTTQAASSIPAASSTRTESSPALVRLTRAELIARADAICRRVNAKRASKTIRNAQEYAPVLLPLASYEKVASAELGKLAPPASMTNDWNQIVVDAQTIATNTGKVGEYAETNNVSAASELFTATLKTQEQMIATAKRNGFKDCAQAT